MSIFEDDSELAALVDKRDDITFELLAIAAWRKLANMGNLPAIEAWRSAVDAEGDDARRRHVEDGLSVVCSACSVDLEYKDLELFTERPDAVGEVLRYFDPWDLTQGTDREELYGAIRWKGLRFTRKVEFPSAPSHLSLVRRLAPPMSDRTVLFLDVSDAGVVQDFLADGKPRALIASCFPDLGEAIVRLHLFLEEIAAEVVPATVHKLEVDRTADVVIGCSRWLGHEHGEGWGKNARPFLFGSALRWDLLWVQRAVEALAPDGRAFAIVSEDCLAAEGPEQSIRRGLIEGHLIEAVISLGSDKAFGRSEALIVLRPIGSAGPDNILFVDGAQARRPNGDADLADLVAERRDAPRRARLVPTAQLAERGYDLVVAAWVNTKSEQLHDLLDPVICAPWSLRPLHELAQVKEGAHAGDEDADFWVSALLSIDDERPRSPWLSIRLNRELLVPAYVKEWLRSDLGRRTLNIAGLDKKGGLKELLIPMPPKLEDQKALVGGLHDAAVAVAALTELRGELLHEPMRLHATLEKIDEMRGKQAEDAWVAALPYPLATILKRAYATADVRRRVDFLLFFFEALVQFTAVVELSLWKAAKPSLNPEEASALDRVRWDQLRAAGGIGGWLAVHAALARAPAPSVASGTSAEAGWVRHLGQDETDPARSLARDLAPEPVVELFSRLTRLKNERKSHNAIADERANADLYEMLQSELLVIRTLLGPALSKLQLVRPLKHASHYEKGVHVGRAELLRGSDPALQEIEVRNAAPLDVEGLHLIFDATRKPIPLVPLLAMRTGPSSEKAACYFFSKMDGPEARWVSYHFEGTPEERTPGDGVSRAFEEFVPLRR